MAEWTRREWLQAALTAAAPEDAGWRLAFRCGGGSAFTLLGSGIVPPQVRPLVLDTPHPDYAGLLREGPAVSPEPYDVLTGRYGLLNATAVGEVFFAGREPQAGVMLRLSGRDAPRFAQLAERVFLARPARRGPLVWGLLPPIGKARIPSLLRTQIEMLLERERRARSAKGRASRQVSIWTLDASARPPLRLARALWRNARRPAFALTATVGGGDTPRLDTVWAGPAARAPEPLDCYSCGGVLWLAVRWPTPAGAHYELWSRQPECWHTVCSGPDFSR